MHSEHNAGAVISGSQQTSSPHGQLKDAVHSPTSVRTILRFPIRASTIISVKCNGTGSPQTNSLSHTHPVVSSRMPCTPLRVCAPSSASQSGLAPSMLSATVLVHHKPTHIHTHPVISSRMPCTPLWVCAPSSASQSGLASLMLSANVLVHRKPTDTHTQWSAQGCRALPYECAHHPCFPIWASTIIDVKCNCTGSPHTNLHTPTPHERLHHPLLLNLGQYHQWCSAQLTYLLVKSTISGKSSAGYEYWCIRQTIITLFVPACL